jgi:hypothetical protein
MIMVLSIRYFLNPDSKKLLYNTNLLEAKLKEDKEFNEVKGTILDHFRKFTKK